MNQKTAEALHELVKAAAKMHGMNPDEVTFTFCLHTEPNICDFRCRQCERQTHHWCSPLPDLNIWKCLHCGHSVKINDTSEHPSGCDCPDCLPDEDFDICECGHSHLDHFNAGERNICAGGESLNDEIGCLCDGFESIGSFR